MMHTTGTRSTLVVSVHVFELQVRGCGFRPTRRVLAHDPPSHVIEVSLPRAEYVRDGHRSRAQKRHEEKVGQPTSVVKASCAAPAAAPTRPAVDGLAVKMKLDGADKHKELGPDADPHCNRNPAHVHNAIGKHNVGSW